MKSPLLKNIVSLTVICLVISVLLAAANAVTAPIIEKAEEQAALDALLVVMPDGKDFSELDTEGYDFPKTVTGAYRESGGGYVFSLETAGYASGLRIMCGVSAGGEVTGAVFLSGSETLGYEKTYGDRFTGLDTAAASGVDTVGGATKTTKAYKNAVLDALSAFETASSADAGR